MSASIHTDSHEQNGQNLKELLEKVIEVETLTGDNKFRCERCCELREVDRFTQILTVPPVLHFSLMRFTFDYDAEERKKSKASIGIPLEIDMGDFVRDADGMASEPIWYDLKGLLLHKGESASHGH